METLRFLQKSVDEAYADAMTMCDTGRLKQRLSREETIGNYVDKRVRQSLQFAYDRLQLPYGAKENITVNNRDYDTGSFDNAYTIPDARVGDVSFDWTLTEKLISTRQVRGFFAADSKPRGVVIIRPTQLGRHGTYMIPRPADLKPRR